MLYDELISNNLDYEQPVLCDLNTNYTYLDLHIKVVEFSKKLSGFGVLKNQRMMIINHNSIETVIHILTCIYLNICFIIVPETSSDDQLQYIMCDAQPFLVLGRTGEKEIIANKMERSLELGDLTYIIYTSGSTGKPKGVMAPQNQVLFCIHAINKRLKNGVDDIILCCLPLSFDYGLYQLFLGLSSKAKIILPQKYMIQEIPQLLASYEVTAFPSMPAMLTLMIRTGLLQKVTLPKLRYITSTGDNFPVALVKQLMSMFPRTEIIPMYGQTECKRVSVMPFNSLNKTLKGSCGLPLDGVKVWIDKPDENGIGELIVAGPNVMAGYLHPDEEAAEYFFYNEEYGRALRTGDLFYIDSDGYLFFYSRKRRIIKVNGYRIGSQELEEIFRENLKTPYGGLRVVGIPDKLCGERILLGISNSINEEETINEVKRINRTLPAYQRVTKLYLPKSRFSENENGKIDDKKLLDEAKTDGVISI